MSYHFEHKSVLVTGASRGIGLAVAEAFLERGADLFVLASSDSIHAVAEELSERYRQPVNAIQSDIADRDGVSASLGVIDRLDVLVNNAGLECITPIDDMSDDCADRFKRIIDINVLGTYYVTRSVLPKMTSGGRIVITSSIWGKTAVAEFSAYCASKHANIGFMRSLARELGPRGITVNAVCPGWVRTDAAMRSLGFMAERSGTSERALLDDILASQAMDGLLTPAEVVEPFLFLASAAAGNITGQTLNVDRGEIMA